MCSPGGHSTLAPRLAQLSSVEVLLRAPHVLEVLLQLSQHCLRQSWNIQRWSGAHAGKERLDGGVGNSGGALLE